MKKALILFGLLLLAGCGPIAPTVAPGAMPTAAATTTPVELDAPPMPTTASASLPTPTPAPQATPAAGPTPLAQPAIIERYRMTPDRHGMAINALFLPGQVWEVAMSGEARAFDSPSLNLQQVIPLGSGQKMLSVMAGDERYVWVLFLSPGGLTGPVELWRITRADFTAQKADIPADCTYEACEWQTLLLDGSVLWLGGYDALLAIDTATLAPLAQVTLTDYGHMFQPANVADIKIGPDGALWVLQQSDVCYIAAYDRQKVLEMADQQPKVTGFSAAYNVDWMALAGGVVWAAESIMDNDDPPKPARLYPVAAAGEDLGEEQGVALPLSLSTATMPGASAYDGKYLWMIDDGMRKLFWFDPLAQQVAGELEIYPGDLQTMQDGKVITRIGFDGQYLWAGGSMETLRIALPWAQP